jgi:hypothetical protein
VNPPKLFVEAGERIGRGVVIDPEIRVGKRGDRGARLRCDCSTVYEAQLSHLFRGAVKSCGCQRRELSAKRPHLPARRLFAQEGQRFGRGVVIGPEVIIRSGGQQRRGVPMRCDCGTEYEAMLWQLAGGAKLSCGCLALDYWHGQPNLARLARWARSPEGREWARRVGEDTGNRPENVERLRKFWRGFWSVPRVGADHEPVEGPGYVDCEYCDPPRRVPEERWEGHWSRNHEPRAGRGAS